jgi:hypothetical protein
MIRVAGRYEEYDGYTSALQNRPRDASEIAIAVVEADENRATGKGSATASSLEKLHQIYGLVSPREVRHLLGEERWCGADQPGVEKWLALGVVDAVVCENAKHGSNPIEIPTLAGC